jgi:type I restriction enzyme R subunit
MAKDVAADAGRGGQFIPALFEAEVAFYDAVASNESAVAEMGGGVLAAIARDLVATIRRSISLDWVMRDDVRTKLRTIIKRLLAKYNYPPDSEAKAIELVIRQMETLGLDARRQEPVITRMGGTASEFQ